MLRLLATSVRLSAFCEPTRNIKQEPVASSFYRPVLKLPENCDSVHPEPLDTLIAADMHELKPTAL